ncbi:hypothetical protein F2P45_09710 [Massilia sp. CCM 8733]|uniref:Uncharacterized protein n=1 Tax=Massilia mucilaginosa TaxID=2609282 RepID=A0ABX0NQY1_9BURK|nr:hypothetical protein [Massilia mucilaginosa]NHZ89286.1 hypothetical protein [Massilia mucilaginosa]
MRELRMKDSGAVVTEAAYKDHYPRVSFAFDWEPLDADWIVPTAPPAAPAGLQAIRNGVEPAGSHWQQAWQLAPAPVPVSVSMLGLRLALIGAGHMATVNAALAEAGGTDGEQARAMFEFATSLRRDHPLVERVRQALRLEPAAMDVLFSEAASFE